MRSNISSYWQFSFHISSFSIPDLVCMIDQNIIGCTERERETCRKFRPTLCWITATMRIRLIFIIALYSSCTLVFLFFIHSCIDNQTMYPYMRKKVCPFICDYVFVCLFTCSSSMSSLWKSMQGNSSKTILVLRRMPKNTPRWETVDHFLTVVLSFICKLRMHIAWCYLISTQ